MKDPKYHTSLYNHKPIGSIDKPLLSNKELAELRIEVENGNHQAYWDTLKIRSIEPKQQKLLTDIINNTIL